jgi:carbamoyl-phosphate synthase large subunit
MIEPRLLLLAPSRRTALARAFQDSAIAHGLQLHLAGADSNPHAPALQCLHSTALLPPFPDPQCAQQLVDFCRRENLRHILPLTNKAVEFLAAQRQNLPQDISVPYLPDARTLTLCHDKLALAEGLLDTHLAVDNRLPACPTFTRDTLPTPPSFPLFAKRRRGEGGQDTILIRDWRDLDHCREKFPDHIYQPYLPGKEFTIDWFSDRSGAPHLIVPRLRLDVRGGETWTGKIDMDSALIDTARKVGLRLGLRGPCTLQCREDAHGRLLFTDVNLRFGSGTVHTIAGGGDIPGLIFDDLLGKTVEFDPARIENGSIFTRHLDGFLIPE